MFWLMFLLGQGLLAMAWWWFSPGGFGPGHPRFWANRVAPPLILAAVIWTLAALRSDRQGPLRLLLAGWPAAWAGMAVALRLLFPVTLAWLWLVPFGVAVAMGLAAIRPWRQGPIDGDGFRAPADGCRRRDGRRSLRRGLAPASGRDASDRPALRWCVPPDRRSARSHQGVSGSTQGSTIQTFDGSIRRLALSRLTISIKPLLRFLSRSPDGSPTVLVRAHDRVGPEPRFRDGWRTAEGSYLLTV